MQIPQSALDSLVRYRDFGCPTGDCLRAVLSNDLFEAFSRADPDYTTGMGAIVKWIYNEMPSGAHGSPGVYRAWLAKGGAKGNADVVNHG